MKFGTLDIVEQPEMSAMPQEAASAWFAAFTDKPLLGATYKPVAYFGGRPTKGVDHVFLAQQTIILAKPERHIALVTINEFGDSYNVVDIQRLF